MARNKNKGNNMDLLLVECKHCGSMYEAKESQRAKSGATIGYDALVAKLEEYTLLLLDELNETVPIAHAHGWKSTNHQRGIELRKEIAELKRAV